MIPSPWLPWLCATSTNVKFGRNGIKTIKKKVKLCQLVHWFISHAFVTPSAKCLLNERGIKWKEKQKQEKPKRHEEEKELGGFLESGNPKVISPAERICDQSFLWSGQKKCQKRI